MIELKPDNGWIIEDADGIRYPWYSAGALEVLDKMDLHGKYIWEYGKGYSTKWFDSRGALTFGVDSKEEWYKFAGGYLHKDKFQYLRSINNGRWTYDIIVIDGDYRDDCTEYAIKKIKKGGIIIIDNWMQPSVPPNEWFRTLDLLAAKKLPHTVYRQEGHPDWSTLIIQC